MLSCLKRTNLTNTKRSVFTAQRAFWYILLAFVKENTKRTSFPQRFSSVWSVSSTRVFPHQHKHNERAQISFKMTFVDTLSHPHMVTVS